MSYQKNPEPYYTGPRQKDRYRRGYSIRWDAGLMGIAKRVLDENAGTEIYMDRALRMQLKIDSVDASHIRAGLLVGHEFLLGKFIFNQRIGVYIFDNTPYFDRIYHRRGIHYRVNNRWS